MRRPRNGLAVLLVAALAGAGCSSFMDERRSSSPRSRESGDWTLIGQRNIDFSREHETIDIASDRHFRTLRVEVKGGPLHVSDMLVTFGDGSTFSPQLRSDFTEGSGSRAIDLPGEARRIERIEVTSRSTSKRDGHATILILAR